IGASGRGTSTTGSCTRTAPARAATYGRCHRPGSPSGTFAWCISRGARPDRAPTRSRRLGQPDLERAGPRVRRLAGAVAGEVCLRGPVPVVGESGVDLVAVLPARTGDGGVD